MKAPGFRRIAAALLALTLAGGTAAAAGAGGVAASPPAAPSHSPAGALPPGLPAIGGPFHLVDQAGQARSDEDFRGKIMLVMFGFTRCPDICPTQLQTIADALDRLDPAVAAKVAPVFITVDPRNDTPDQLAAYVAQFHPAITGLTGSDEAIRSVLRAYRVHVLLPPVGDPDGAISHTAFLYIMGPEGGFRTLLMPNATAEEIAARLARYGDGTQLGASRS